MDRRGHVLKALFRANEISEAFGAGTVTCYNLTMPGKTKEDLVVGSIAYDHVMHYDGDFKDVILPNHYSLAVTTSNRMVSYGGCGGNIAYNLKLLGESPFLSV